MVVVRRYVLVIALILACAPFVLRAQTADQLRSQIASHQSELDSLNKEIAQFQDQLTVVGAKKQTLQSAVQALDISYKQTQAKIKAIQNQIATTELEIQQLSGDIQSKESSITVDSAAIGESIRGLREDDRASLVEMVLANQSVSALWNDAETAIDFQENLRTHVNSLESAKQVLTEDKTATEKKRAELVSQKNNLASEQQSLAVQKKAQQDLLTQTKSQESNYQALLKQKQASKVAFEQSLNELESKLKYTLDPSKLPRSGSGVLQWPLDKIKITQEFGVTADSGRLYSSGSHNGVDFAATIGTPVKVALSGTVRGTGNSDATKGCYSYGKWVLVDHANGLTTLYAHLSQINVSEGDGLVTGQVVGYSGATGYATGPHLHLGLYATNAVQIRKLGTNTPCGPAVLPVSPTSGYLNPLSYL